MRQEDANLSRSKRINITIPGDLAEKIAKHRSIEPRPNYSAMFAAALRGHLERRPLCRGCFEHENRTEGKAPEAEREDAFPAACAACGMELR